MVSELNNATLGALQSGGYIPLASSASAQSSALPASDYSTSERQQVVTIKAASGTFRELLDTKNTAAGIANAVREAGRSLDKVDVVLQKISEKISLVKNYPPFPAGNERRVEYLNSIDGLRKELQAIIVPPVTDTVVPVFYPTQSEFPELDAKVPSDAAVLAFGDAVKAVQTQLNVAHEELKAQSAQLLPQGDYQLPESPAEAEIPAISAAAAARLGGARAIAGNSDVLAQIGG